MQHLFNFGRGLTSQKKLYTELLEADSYDSPLT